MQNDTGPTIGSWKIEISICAPIAQLPAFQICLQSEVEKRRLLSSVIARIRMIIYLFPNIEPKLAV